MVRNQISFFRQSIHLAQKSALAFALIGVLSCSSSGPKKHQETPSLQAASTPSGLRLTSIGHNQKARFSPDGKSVIFISSARKAHKQMQAYEISLENFREKRITFHDGDCTEVDYSPNGEHLIYASTTDELKERPRLLGKQPESKFLPTDLYLTDRKGSQIQRLTKTPGFQGEVAWIGAQQILFVTANGNGKTKINRLTLRDQKVADWEKGGEGESLRTPATDAAATSVAWVIEKKDKASLGLKIRGKVQTLEVPFTEVQSLQWIKGPKSEALLLISAKKTQAAPLSAWVLDPVKKCHTLLFNEPGGDLKDLSASKNQERIVLTFESQKDSQLFLREFPQMPESCEPL